MTLPYSALPELLDAFRAGEGVEIHASSKQGWSISASENNDIKSDTPHNWPQVHEDIVTVRGCPEPLRQIAVRGLGHRHRRARLRLAGPPPPSVRDAAGEAKVGVNSLFENTS